MKDKIYSFFCWNGWYMQITLVLFPFSLYASNNLVHNSPSNTDFSCTLLLFPVDYDTHEFFCRLQSDIFDATSVFHTDHVVLWNAPRENSFPVWRHAFFVLRNVHLPGVLHIKKHSKFVLIIFYLQLTNSDHADSSTADKSHGKLSSSR